MTPPTVQGQDVCVSCTSLASWGLDLLHIFETSRPRWSRTTGTRGQRPPQRPSAPALHPPSPWSTFQILLCRARHCLLGIRLWLGILAVEAACQHCPSLLEGGTSLAGTDQQVRAQPGELWRPSPHLHGPVRHLCRLKQSLAPACRVAPVWSGEEGSLQFSRGVRGQLWASGPFP